MIDPAEICICGHTYEVHFGHDCARLFPDGTPCPCKQFVLHAFGVKLFEALKTCVRDSCDTDEHRAALKRAEALIREAESE